MDDRSDLHALLCMVLGSDQVYFQPPESIKMQYPAIVYNRCNMTNRFADNGVYSVRKQYEVTVIDPDPDSEIPDRINEIPMTRFNRHFTSDNLNHDVFTIYY